MIQQNKVFMDILFSTFNARYSHSALSLRCLRANLGTLKNRSLLVEFDNRIPPHTAAEILLEHQPGVVLFSVYIWNLTITSETALILKKVRPDLKIVIGGPEVSYNTDSPAIPAADHQVCGEGEAVIESLCTALLKGSPLPPVIRAEEPDLSIIDLPYDEYSDEDIAHRRIYVESARGCPFQCEYCLSSIDHTLRFFPLDRLFPAYKKLIDRGARIFKFLDRSFNVNPAHAEAVLRFFLENRRKDMMLHLEWEPDVLPPALKNLMMEAPRGFFQIEVGVQTFNPDVAARIRRHLRPERVETHLRTLTGMPAVHLHADLIAGLPGESFESISESFNRLYACGPQEIQLGVLKKLHGAPIARHDTEWQMVYNPAPPYDVLQTSLLTFSDLLKIRRFARLWDLMINNRRFPETALLLWENSSSVFDSFMEWSEWLYRRTGSFTGISPRRLAGFLEIFLIKKRGLHPDAAGYSLKKDLQFQTAGTKGIERQTRRYNKKTG